MLLDGVNELSGGLEIWTPTGVRTTFRRAVVSDSGAVTVGATAGEVPGWAVGQFTWDPDRSTLRGLEFTFNNTACREFRRSVTAPMTLTGGAPVPACDGVAQVAGLRAPRTGHAPVRYGDLRRLVTRRPLPPPIRRR